MEEKNEQPIEQEPVEKPEVKEKSGFMKWLKGNNRKEYTENISFVIIVVSGVLVALGIGLGSFIQGTIVMGIIGSFLVMVGIVTHIISQFIEV
jgi:hypothetical protein